MKPLFAFLSAGLLFLPACSRSNNLIFGWVQAQVGSHPVVVTDCYRLRVDPPQEVKGDGGQIDYRFTPCRDADLLIRNEEVFVNGKSYGPVGPGDAIMIDHSVVSIRRNKG